MSDRYTQFLETKMRLAPQDGFPVDLDEVTPEPLLKAHQRAVVPWACAGGRRALFLSFGLGKTRIQLEILRLVLKRHGGPVLVILPLGVRQEFRRDAGILGIATKFIRRAEEIEPDEVVHLTNYETVRDGKLDPNLFLAVSLDEASCLRSYGSKTFQTFLTLFEQVRFKFVATATPSPNRTKELIHYAGFLGVMDTGQALTRFFQRNSEKANDLTLYPHKVDEFWLWVHSWALFLQRPSDLGFSDKGYDLPPLDVRWHEIATDHSAAGADRDGQALMFRDHTIGLQAEAAERRDTLPARIARMQEIVARDGEDHRILWHDLEAERHAICRALPNAVPVYGSQDLDEREQAIIDFSDGRFRHLAAKPVIAGSGCNFQRHCHKALFLGVSHKFNDFIQAIFRIQRFQQAHPVEIDIIHSEAEREVVRDLKRKWTEYDEQMARMAEIVRKYGLNQLPAHEVLKRSIGINRIEAKGERFRIAHNDAVAEAASMEEASVGQIVTSIPFSNQYEYCESYNDFGHTDDNRQFWGQMDFLTPHLLRILQPGRLACIHVKDRVLFGNVTGEGVPTISPFHAEAIFHYLGHGFQYLGMITVVTDVVRENNGTYRLGYTEMLKDGTKMGVGSPEYVLLFRRPQSDKGKAYADVPVTKRAEDYSLARWQVDAHAFWRSGGDRLVTTDELLRLGPGALVKAFTDWSLSAPYDYQAHVALGEAIEAKRKGALPRTFMALAPGSHHPDVWHDVVRMRTLNAEQVAGNREKHVCPLQIDIVERLIARYSNPGDLIHDPFGGIMTVPYCAILAGRRGSASELHPTYFRDGLRYCRAAEEKRRAPSLFEALEASEAA